MKLPDSASSQGPSHECRSHRVVARESPNDGFRGSLGCYRQHRVQPVCPSVLQSLGDSPEVRGILAALKPKVEQCTGVAAYLLNRPGVDLPGWLLRKSIAM